MKFLLILVYDPDPISSLRKRRISADSVDSGSASGKKLCRFIFVKIIFYLQIASDYFG
jgi:hypothetical protein